MREDFEEEKEELEGKTAKKTNEATESPRSLPNAKRKRS